MDELINMLTTGANNKTILTIDEPSRSINYAGELILGVECDKQAERIYFHIPRTIIMGNTTPVDLKGSNIEIYVNFENALGNVYRTQCVDKPIIKDSTDVDDGTTPLEFSWVISNEVTAARGTVKFSICVEVLNAEKEITNEWYTIPFEGKILKGVYVSDTTNEVVIHPQASMALLMSRVAEFEEFLSDYAGYTKRETDSMFTALESKYALQDTVNKIISPASTGVNGQLLKSNGYGAKPTWVTLNSDMVSIDSSIGNGLVFGSLNLSNHLKAIYEALDKAPTHSDIAEAVKQVAIGDLNITSGDISHNGSDLNQYLVNLSTELINKTDECFVGVDLTNGYLTFTRNNGTKSNITLTSYSIKHGTKNVGDVLTTASSYANNSFCEADASGGAITFTTNGGSTSRLPLNLTTNHITHGGIQLNTIIDSVHNLTGWRKCNNLGIQIGVGVATGVNDTFESDPDYFKSGYYVFKFKTTNNVEKYYMGHVVVENDSNSYLKGNIRYVLNKSSEGYTTYDEYTDILKINCVEDEHGWTAKVSFHTLKSNVTNEMSDVDNPLVTWQGVWRLDI